MLNMISLKASCRYAENTGSSAIKLLLNCLLLVFSFTLPAQSIKTIKVKRNIDTVTFTCLFEITYDLKKVSENGVTLPYNCYKGSSFSIVEWYWDSKKVQRGDSLARIDWYQLKNGQCLNCDPHVAIWKVRLNKPSNTLLFRRTWPVAKKPSVDVNDPDQILFKVVKCTCSELILEDIPITSKHRRYYFQEGSNADNVKATRY